MLDEAPMEEKMHIAVIHEQEKGPLFSYQGKNSPILTVTIPYWHAIIKAKEKKVHLVRLTNNHLLFNRIRRSSLSMSTYGPFRPVRYGMGYSFSMV